MRSDLVDIDVVIHWQTEKAWLVETATSSPEKVWVPASMCEVSDRKAAPSKAATMTLPRGIAIEKGLV